MPLLVRSPLLLMLACAAMLTACSGGKPESAVETFYEAVAKGDVDKATAQISFANVPADRVVQARGKVQMIVGEMQNRVEANGGLDRVEILETTMDDTRESAQVRARVVFHNGRDDTQNHRLVKDDGDWKIQLR
ncbi:DUF4878 domain-containing protein [Achromobacter sp. GG226]|uniref:DUF4878 domain-containing protein n=1 Tax=Verticiella alkaliphila TaxID=2779529 RepID=UPI001C0D255D|nr:DUF4878 domain-containing protein [Verticiella sp. GG226]MBU4609368.1 DUF4878 domain-containing protein [Verticiella sp. GG226]